MTGGLVSVQQRRDGPRDSTVRQVPSRTVVAALIAFLVVALALFGALEDLPEWVRGGTQALGTLAGIYLGAHFQAHDQQRTAEGAAKSSILNLVALAKSVGALLESLREAKTRVREFPPKSVDSYLNAYEGLIGGVDAQARALLAQAEAAAAAWYPFVRDDDPFMQQLESGSAPQGLAAQEEEQAAR
jgi:hypothetical protein